MSKATPDEQKEQITGEESIKELLKPIAIHEAKSAYHKARLVAILAARGTKKAKGWVDGFREKRKDKR